LWNKNGNANPEFYFNLILLEKIITPVKHYKDKDDILNRHCVRIFNLLRSPRIDSEGPISPGCVAKAGRYDNPIPTRLLPPIEMEQKWYQTLSSAVAEFIDP
jgi:hypothetical protein